MITYLISILISFVVIRIILMCIKVKNATNLTILTGIIIAMITVIVIDSIYVKHADYKYEVKDNYALTRTAEFKHYLVKDGDTIEVWDTSDYFMELDSGLIIYRYNSNNRTWSYCDFQNENQYLHINDSIVEPWTTYIIKYKSLKPNNKWSTISRTVVLNTYNVVSINSEHLESFKNIFGEDFIYSEPDSILLTLIK